MLEYFLTAFVPDEEDKVEMARAVLQGVCAMSGGHEMKRVLMFQGPDRPDGFKKIKGLEKTPNGKSFAELQRYLAKQSFFVRLEYPVTKQQFGSGLHFLPLDKESGTLRWTDIPEPVKGEDVHICRKTLDIDNQDNLVSIMGQNSHTFKRDFVEESYIYALDNVQYRLMRNLIFPGDVTPEDVRRDTLPPLSELQPVVPYWTLHLKVLVAEPNPDLATQAINMLASARRGLGTCFDFKQVDRRFFDSRVSVNRASNTTPQQLGKVIPVEKRG
ncbi:mediator complex, subunit Med18 [Coniochaeta sp. 2T2.1]|nr:mediator complex, subunit Med18 [Coniochaeta sp. 2T2.1]